MGCGAIRAKLDKASNMTNTIVGEKHLLRRAALLAVCIGTVMAWITTRSVTLPLLRPGLFAGGTIVLIWSFTVNNLRDFASSFFSQFNLL